MKKLFNVTLALVLASSLVACSSNHEASTTTPAATATVESTEEATATEETTSLANPWVDCDSLEEAEKLAGFEFEIPSDDSDTEIVYRAIEGQLIEIDYDPNGDDPLVLRKGVGTDDVSGDYTSYDFGGNIEVGDDNLIVNVLGDSEDLIHTATWTVDNYSYSLYSPVGVSVDALDTVIPLLK